MNKGLVSDIERGLQALTLAYSSEQLEKLQHYVFLLQKWNAAYNLVADSEETVLIERHLLDSVAISPLLQGKTFLDFGTGAGLPGIPLAILNPDKEFILLDSNGKKTRFLFQVKLELGLDNVSIENCRVEHYKNQGQIDIVLCRAFSSIPDMLEKTASLLSQGSRLLAMKGQIPESEIAALSPDWNIIRIQKLDVPHSKAVRHVIEIGRKDIARN